MYISEEVQCVDYVFTGHAIQIFKLKYIYLEIQSQSSSDHGRGLLNSKF
jgi:hypothetical protein